MFDFTNICICQNSDSPAAQMPRGCLTYLSKGRSDDVVLLCTDAQQNQRAGSCQRQRAEADACSSTRLRDVGILHRGLVVRTRGGLGGFFGLGGLFGIRRLLGLGGFFGLGRDLERAHVAKAVTVFVHMRAGFQSHAARFANQGVTVRLRIIMLSGRMTDCRLRCPQRRQPNGTRLLLRIP